LNPVEALIFSGFFPIAHIGKFTAIVILHFHLHLQITCKLFHMNYFSRAVFFSSSSLRFTDIAYAKKHDFSSLRTFLHMLILENEKQPAKKTSEQCFWYEVKPTCQNSAP